MLARLFDLPNSQRDGFVVWLERTSANHELCIAPQVIYELRVVLTRPLSDNGLGYSGEEFRASVREIIRGLTLLPDPPDLVERWIAVCDEARVIGKQCHDARLVAWMRAHEVPAILTFNARHFAAYGDLTVITPN